MCILNVIAKCTLLNSEVHKAISKARKITVAIKRILMHNEKEGMPVTALREIKILKAMKHSCVIELLDMFVVPSKSPDAIIFPSYVLIDCVR